MTEIVYGAKYQAGLDVKEIAKRVRAEIAAAVKAGTLPKFKWGVRIQRYAGGRSITVKISEASFPLLNPERLRRDIVEPYSYHADALPWRSAEAARVVKAVEAIVAAYNFDGSDSMTDYFHVNFYAHVETDHVAEEAEREAMRAAIAAGAPVALAPVGLTGPAANEVDEDEEVLRRSSAREPGDVVTAAEGWML